MQTELEKYVATIPADAPLWQAEALSCDWEREPLTQYLMHHFQVTVRRSRHADKHPAARPVLLITGKGPIVDYDSARAFAGFAELGYNVHVCQHYELMEHATLPNKNRPNLQSFLRGYSAVVADVPLSKKILWALGARPEDLTYPPALRSYQARKIERLDLFKALARVLEDDRPYFIKPVAGKAFRAGIFHPEDVRDARMEFINHEGMEVWLAPIVSMRVEYRCFVLDNEIVDIRHYAVHEREGQAVDGEEIKYLGLLPPNVIILKGMVAEFAPTAPRAYVLDIAMRDSGQLVLVECNEGYAFGSYGLEPALYAEMLAARWQELMALEPADA